MIWFTSDQHFGHYNIIKYCNRPFINEMEMGQYIRKAYNNMVKPNDLVIFVGDFTFNCTELELTYYLKNMYGHKILIRGNHDRMSKTRYLKAGFDEVHNHMVINNLMVVHNPRSVDNFDKFIVHGHNHNNGPKVWYYGINVSVDQWEFKPVPMKTVNFYRRVMSCD